MARQPLHAGVLRLLEAARDEEWTLDRSLGADREGVTIRWPTGPTSGLLSGREWRTRVGPGRAT